MSVFRFKQFQIQQENAPFKISTDSVLLGAWANVDSAKNILDIGTGCGLLAMMCAQRSTANISAIEIEKLSSEIALENFKNSKWSDRIELINVSLQNFVGVNSQKFDYIICNPPYFQNSTHNKEQAVTRARQNETLGFEDLLQGAMELLSGDGVLALVLPNVEAGLFKVKAMARGLHCLRKLEALKKEGKTEALILSEWTKKKQPCRVDKLVIRDKYGNYSAEHLKLTEGFYLDKNHKS